MIHSIGRMPVGALMIDFARIAALVFEWTLLAKSRNGYDFCYTMDALFLLDHPTQSSLAIQPCIEFLMHN